MIIEKNEQKLDFTNKEITKGQSAGKKFLGVDVTPENFGEVCTFFGNDFIIGKINAAVRQLCITAHADATDANGNLDPDLFQRSILNARTTSASLAELREEQQGLIAEFTTVDFNSDAGRARATEIQSKLQELAVLMEARKRAPRVSEDDDSKDEAKK